MWNDAQFFQVFISVRENAKQKIFLPLLLHIGSLASFLQDYSDIIGLFPADTQAGKGGERPPKTMGQIAAALRMAIAFMRESHGLRVKVKAQDQEDGVYVDIRAL